MPLLDNARRKTAAATYGKPNRSATSIFDLDTSPQKPKKVLPSLGASATKTKPLTTPHTIPASITKQSAPSPGSNGGGKLVRASSTAKSSTDLFDVPSSDEERSTSAQTTRVRNGLKSPSGAPMRSQGRGSAVQSYPTSGRTELSVRTKVESAKKRKREETIRSKSGTIQREALRQTSPVKVLKVEAGVSHVPNRLTRQPTTNSRPTKRLRTPTLTRSPPARLRTSAHVSAPAILATMLSEDIVVTEDAGVDVAQPEEMDSELLPSTPPRQIQRATTDNAQLRTMTPREKVMWERLVGQEESIRRDVPSTNDGTNSAFKDDQARVSEEQAHSMYRRQGSSRLMDVLKQATTNESDSSDMDESSEIGSSPPPVGNNHSQTTASQPQSVRLKDDTQVSIQHGKSNIKATYSQQRSYLEEKDENAAFDMLADELGQATSQSRPPLQAYNSFSQPADLDVQDGEEDSQQAQPKTVFDLRAAGSRKRLLEELESLVHEIGGQGFDSISARRSAMIELAMKLLKKEAVACFLEQDLTRKLVEQCSLVNDLVFQFASAIALLVILGKGASLSVLETIRRSENFTHILSLLSGAQDISFIVKDRKMKMSKMAQLSCVELKDAVLKAGVIGDGFDEDYLSPQIVALALLEVMVRRMREAKSKEVLVGEKVLDQLLGILDGYIGRGDDPSHSIIPATVLSILESSSLYKVAQRTRSGWTLSQLTIFATSIMPRILTRVIEDSKDGTKGMDDKDANIISLTLKICVNVTNDSPRACNAFSDPRVVLPLFELMNQSFETLESFTPTTISPPNDDDTPINDLQEPYDNEDNDDDDELDSPARLKTLDTLILSLGSLMNLAEHSATARSAALRHHIPPSEPPTSTSKAHQHQHTQTSPLEKAISHFLRGQSHSQQASSLSAAQLNIPYGYLSVLLCNLCLDHTVREFIVSQLPGKKIDVLIEAVEAFMLIHLRTYGGGTGTAAGNEEGDGGFEGGEGLRLVERMRGMVGRVRGFI